MITDFIEAGEQLQTELAMGPPPILRGGGGGGGGGGGHRILGLWACRSRVDPEGRVVL